MVFRIAHRRRIFDHRVRLLATATIIYFRTFAALLAEHVHNLVQ
jgi:hypothetical protein